MSKPKKIVQITVSGGVIQDVQVPKGVIVQIKDYDVDSDDIRDPDYDIREDKDGDPYYYSEWTSAEKDS
jgi:hypothetical protein